MAKVITVITPQEEDNLYNVKIEVEDLEGYPLEIIINALVSVTNQFIDQYTRKKQKNEEALQLEQSQTTTENAWNRRFNHSSQPNPYG